MKSLLFSFFLISVLLLFSCSPKDSGVVHRPNILFIITDDQSWEHLGCYGDTAIRTPSVDRLADEGLRFEHAYTACSSCSPSRAGLITGQDIYRLEEGGVLSGFLRDKYPMFPELLSEAGYKVGATGKRYWPRTLNVEGAVDEPIGSVYDKHRQKEAPEFVSKTDYSENFKQFLDENTEGMPFFFWVGTGEPHRKYEIDRGVKTGIDTSKIRIPAFYPEVPMAKLDIADYLSEIEWVDKEVGEMIEILESYNMLENTLVVYTSDNGMPMPRAKATLYDHGVRMPLVMMWEKEIKSGRVVTDPVSLIDMAPTFLELAGIEVPKVMTGRSITNLIFSRKSGDLDKDREFVVSSFEKHTNARADSLGFPRRAIHTDEWTYIINYEPTRFPMGSIDFLIPGWDILGDTDPGRFKEYYKENFNSSDFNPFWELSFGKVPREQLFNKISDPDMINNLAYDLDYNSVRLELKAKLEKYLEKTGDPRFRGESPWDNYHLDKPPAIRIKTGR